MKDKKAEMARHLLNNIDKGVEEYENDMKALCICSGALEVIDCPAEEYCYWNLIKKEYQL